MKRLTTDKHLKEKLGGCSDMTIWASAAKRKTAEAKKCLGTGT
jgi:hypothetical protein